VDVPDGGTTTVGKPPENGTVTIDEKGKWVYTPGPGFTGKDTFSIVITDENGNEEEFLYEIDVEEIPLGGLELPDGVSKLPKTGESSKLLYELAGLGLITAFVILRKRRKWNN